MIKNFILFYILFLTSSIFSSSYILKDTALIEGNICRLSDIIVDKDPNLDAIVILENINTPYLLSSKEILDFLFKNKIYNVSLIGEEVLIEKKSDADIRSSNTFLSELKDYFYGQVNNKHINLKLQIIKTTPEINIDSLDNKIEWEYPKTGDLLKNYKNINKINFSYKNEKYSADIKLDLFCNLWISKKSFMKNDFLNVDSFYPKESEAADLNNYQDIVFDIDNYNGFRFNKNIQPGEILLNTFLKKVPLIIKNEQVKAYYTRNRFQLILDSVSLQDGFENEKIKVRLFNKKEVIGVLKYKNGSKYVEI